MMLPLLIAIGGLCHFGILVASALVPKVLDWRTQLRLLQPLCRHVVWTHGAFIVLVIVGFGSLSLGLASDLAAGTALARGICAFIGLFWLSRLVIQLFIFDARPFLTTRFLTLGYHGLTVVFIYLSCTYLAAALGPRI
ncbi:MAG TPA: hypothetical protein VHM90_19240 [Phycisphaerae bacterium]|jgi:hypothetical protein|nr:hypothetical protein [Phycisphaerae bacterium]